MWWSWRCGVCQCYSGTWLYPELAQGKKTSVFISYSSSFLNPNRYRQTSDPGSPDSPPLKTITIRSRTEPKLEYQPTDCVSVGWWVGLELFIIRLRDRYSGPRADLLRSHTYIVINFSAEGSTRAFRDWWGRGNSRAPMTPANKLRGFHFLSCAKLAHYHQWSLELGRPRWGFPGV